MHVPFRALQELFAEKVFQSADVLAHRRLCQRESFRRTSEALQLDNFAEYFESVLSIENGPRNPTPVVLDSIPEVKQKSRTGKPQQPIRLDRQPFLTGKSITTGSA